MKRIITHTILVATALTMFTATNANATSWRINNDASKKAHFTSIDAAMSSADVVAGDTLYLDPGCSLGSQTISKRVTLIGTSYYSTAHSIAQLTGTLIITAANVKVEGVFSSSAVSMRANYITLERCRIQGNISQYYYNAQYATIRQCRCAEISGNSSTSTSSMGWTIENCIIRGSITGGIVNNLYNPIIRNNYIRNESTNTNREYYSYGLSGISGGFIENNIILTALKDRVLYDVTNSTVQNNVFSCAETTYESTYPRNTCLDMAYSNAEALVFTKTGDDMNIYRLKDDSPAKGAGTNGEDCGPFAGGYPFVPYCYPLGMPVITNSQIGVRAVDGKVSVKQTVVIQND